MSRYAELPCFACGRELLNVFSDCVNQPQEGTEFRTYGHYGSTFWDSFDGEELVLNVCDECLTAYKERLAQQKRYLPVKSESMMCGRQWIDRPMVPYTGNTDNGSVNIEPEEICADTLHIEWMPGAEALKTFLLEREDDTHPK